MSVMGVKTGLNVFSSAKPSTSMKSEGVSNASAGDFEKAFGDQGVGDVLNKIADPNWVDPSKKMRVAGNNQMDKDAFLKLMLAQMKHQDPTNPMQSHEMAAQLASFTSLEQLNNINTTLEGMSKAQSPNAGYQALALMGKKVSGDATKLTRAVGDTRHEFNFELLGDAQKVNAVVKDEAGNVVRKLELGEMKKGRNTIDWNGMTDEGMPARPGEYKISIEAQSSQGTKVYAKTSFEGRITGMSYTPEGPVLLVGSQTVKLSDVRKIEEIGPEELLQSKPMGTIQPQKQAARTMTAPQATAPQQADENVGPAEEPAPSEEGNIADVPMSGELMQKIAKGK
jgi:flagellar basal-body rod modification protein FlgD